MGMFQGQVMVEGVEGKTVVCWNVEREKEEGVQRRMERGCGKRGEEEGVMSGEMAGEGEKRRVMVREERQCRKRAMAGKEKELLKKMT